MAFFLILWPEADQYFLQSSLCIQYVLEKKNLLVSSKFNAKLKRICRKNCYKQFGPSISCMILYEDGQPRPLISHRNVNK